LDYLKAMLELKININSFKRTLIVCIFSLLCLVVSATEIKFEPDLAVASCTDKWTERGVLNGRMFSYCMDKQTEGYAESLYLYNKYSNIEPVELIDEVVSSAMDTWLNRREYQMDMVAYEIKEEGEAYLNIAYEVSAGNVDAQKLEICKSKWLSAQDPMWSMVEFCLDN